LIDIDVVKRLGTFELAARFSVPAHGVTAIFGRSGAGKSSLINLVAGITRPDRGTIQLGETTLFDSSRGIDLPIEERAIGYVFQDARLLPHLSVRSNLLFGARRARRRRHADGLSVSSVVEVLGIEALLDRRPHHLSTGERQRVALGRALLSQPRVLLMDEPMAALDASRKAELLPYIERLRSDFGIPILYVSHSLDEITRLADHMVILSEGKSVACGDLYAVMGSPAHAPFIGRYEAGAVLECTVLAHSPEYEMTTLRFDGGELRVPAIGAAPGTTVRVRVRARDVALARERSESISISNQLEGRVIELIARHGPYMEVAVALGASTIRSLITRESCERLGLKAGQPVWALVRSVALDQRSVAA
jgi:molybdate transport system ATP-binding protein